MENLQEMKTILNRKGRILSSPAFMVIGVSGIRDHQPSRPWRDSNMISPPPCRVILICTKCKAQILHPMTDSEVVNGMTYFPMIHRFKDSEVVLCAKCEAIYQTQIKGETE